MIYMGMQGVGVHDIMNELGQVKRTFLHAAGDSGWWELQEAGTWTGNV